MQVRLGRNCRNEKASSLSGGERLFGMEAVGNVRGRMRKVELFEMIRKRVRRETQRVDNGKATRR